MKRIKNLLLFAALTISSVLMARPVAAADTFELQNLQVVCEPQYIKAGETTKCYIIGRPNKANGTMHGYVTKVYTTLDLKVSTANKEVTGTGVGYMGASSVSGDDTSRNHLTSNTDIVDELKTYSCEYDSTYFEENGIATSDFVCAVFYTPNTETVGVFTPDKMKTAFQKFKTDIGTEAAKTFDATTYANFAVVGSYTVQIDPNASARENCGEMCVKVWRIPAKQAYNYVDECQNITDPTELNTKCGGANTGRETNDYKCAEVHMHVDPDPGSDPPSSGAFVSYVLLAAGALIAVSAVAITKKNNKFGRI